MKSPFPLLAACLLALGIALPGAAQSSAFPEAKAAPPAPGAKPEAEKKAAPAREFGGVELGMDRDAVIEALKKNYLFAYRGPEDVFFLLSPNQSLIEVSGLSFVKRGYFQFYEGKLWTIILVLDPAKIDHYSIYATLVGKYGEPGLLDPKEARWEDASVRMALERPLTLRYMDMAVFGRLRDEAKAGRSFEEFDREGFLGGL